MIDFETQVRRPVIDRTAVDGTAIVPSPGQGRTAMRHRILAELGRADLSMARLGAAHIDALAILYEGGREPLEGVMYGVWAGDDPQSKLHARRTDGDWSVTGVKPFCSGARFVSAALVTAHNEQGPLLFEVQLSTRGIRVERASGSNPAMADPLTSPVSFDRVMLSEASLVGGPDWYRNRPGYWHGAIGMAACWAGGAKSLVDAARQLHLKNPHSRAHMTALDASAWSMTSILDQAGREIDADPSDRHGRARRRALMVRHLIAKNCAEVLDRFERAAGSQLLASDEHVARQHTALSVFIRQCQGQCESAQWTAPTPGAPTAVAL
jgi:alkylation response protein AidB-like acyl-CoA dehydrogenase